MKEYLKLRKEGLKKRVAKGFTLMEMLIVVAIIAVLIAIAITIFTTQLEKSRDTTSIANVRSAYAEAQAAYLTETSDGDVTVTTASGKVTTVAVANVKFLGVQNGWGGADANLPKNVTWVDGNKGLTEAVGGKAGTCTVTFNYTYPEGGGVTAACTVAKTD